MAKMPHGSQRKRKLVVMIVRLFAQDKASQFIGRSPVVPFIRNG